MGTKFVFFSGLAVTLYCNVLSQWNSDPYLTTPLCTDTLEQRYPQLISDGKGGAIIAWWDDRTAVYAQRIDVNGIPLWDSGGIPVCTIQAEIGYVNETGPPQLISDGKGGSIIVWADRRNGDSDIFAQHVDSNGNILWDPLGVPICTLERRQFNIELISDAVDGAIIVWSDERSDLTGFDIYAQRIGGDGMIQWTPNGVPICVINSFQRELDAIDDGNGGAIIAWSDYRKLSGTGGDIYAQRINSSGVVQWTNNGTLVCAASTNFPLEICSDPDGGAIIAWRDYSTYTASTVMIAQRINASGTPQWTTNGVGIRIGGVPVRFDMVGDNSGGAFIVWEDSRNFPTDDREIYAQYVNSSGNTLWGFNGIPISTADELQLYPQVVLDGEGGIFVAWEDGRLQDNHYGKKVYLQRIDSLGLPVWEHNGIAVCKANLGSSQPQLINDGMDDVILVWVDNRTLYNSDIYSQHIDKNTFPGKPFPEIIAITDVPDDNGGKIRITWSSSAVDVSGLSPQIVTYGIWRKTFDGYIPLSENKSFNLFSQYDSLGTEYENVATIPAVQSEIYNAVVNTLNDLVDETFLITAHGEIPNHYLVSSVMSGQSINNSVATSLNDFKDLPQNFELFQNYPNPFNSVTTIRWHLPVASHVLLIVYDIFGREITLLVNEDQPDGNYETNFSAVGLESGIYYFMLETEKFIDSKPLIISR